jgi:hypothetical protein
VQPKSFAESDYCYSDRLRSEILDLILQPKAFGFCLLRQNLRAVLSPAEAEFRDEASFRLRCASPEGTGTSFRSLRAETLLLSEAL